MGDCSNDIQKYIIVIKPEKNINMREVYLNHIKNVSDNVQEVKCPKSDNYKPNESCNLKENDQNNNSVTVKSAKADQLKDRMRKLKKAGDGQSQSSNAASGSNGATSGNTKSKRKKKP
jgi:hypothetical protein